MELLLSPIPLYFNLDLVFDVKKFYGQNIYCDSESVFNQKVSLLRKILSDDGVADERITATKQGREKRKKRSIGHNWLSDSQPIY